MLELRMEKGSLFQKVLEAILDLVNVASVDCSSKGFSLQALNAEEVAILSLFFPSEALHSYRCDEDRSMGIAIADMVKFLRASNDGDTITIKADNDNFNDITITVESPVKNKTIRRDLKLVDARSQRLEIPDCWHKKQSKYYQAIFCMPSAVFMENCKTLSDIGDNVLISVYKERIEFFASGRIGCMNIAYKLNKTDEPEKAVTLTHMREPVSLVVNLRYMTSCAKVSTLFDQVKICLSTTQPMMVECKIKEKGYTRYFVVPRIQIKIEESEGEEGETEIQDEGSPRKKAKRSSDRKEDEDEERPKKKKGSKKEKNDEKEDEMLG